MMTRKQMMKLLALATAVVVSIPVFTTIAGLLSTLTALTS